MSLRLIPGDVDGITLGQFLLYAVFAAGALAEAEPTSDDVKMAVTDASLAVAVVAAGYIVVRIMTQPALVVERDPPRPFLEFADAVQRFIPGDGFQPTISVPAERGRETIRVMGPFDVRQAL